MSPVMYWGCTGGVGVGRLLKEAGGGVLKAGHCPAQASPTLLMGSPPLPWIRCLLCSRDSHTFFRPRWRDGKAGQGNTGDSLTSLNQIS